MRQWKRLLIMEMRKSSVVGKNSRIPSRIWLFVSKECLMSISFIHSHHTSLGISPKTIGDELIMPTGSIENPQSPGQKKIRKQGKCCRELKVFIADDGIVLAFQAAVYSIFDSLCHR